MKRRDFLLSVFGATAVPALQAAPKNMKITRVRYYKSPITRPMFNQSFDIVLVDTDQGLTGIGEGGSADTLRECAEMVIGEDPMRTDHLWQMMYRGRFYPAGREKLDAMGAIDLALWDLKGKALGVPVWQLLGGKSRDHVECYSTGYPNQGDLTKTARTCVESGFRAFRTSVADPGGAPFNSRQMVHRTFEACQAIREGVGKEGDWAIDYHTRLDLPDAVRLSTLIEPLEPYFVEDLVRSENPELYRSIRQQTKVPIAVGEQFGDRWDINRMIEQDWIDYSRVSIPNCGGLTEYIKQAALCDTHYVGLTPHFTGPVGEAALVHACAAFPGQVMMEMTGTGQRNDIGYLPKCYDFKNGKLWPNDRPGLGVEFDQKALTLTAEWSQANRPITIYRRPDGSFTNW